MDTNRQKIETKLELGLKLSDKIEKKKSKSIKNLEKITPNLKVVKGGAFLISVTWLLQSLIAW